MTIVQAGVDRQCIPIVLLHEINEIIREVYIVISTYKSCARMVFDNLVSMLNTSLTSYPSDLRPFRSRFGPLPCVSRLARLHSRPRKTALTSGHLVEHLKKLLRDEIPNLQIPPQPSKIYTIKNQPILGDVSSDVKKLQDEFDKEESGKMKVIVDSLGLVVQPDEIPELNSLKGDKIRKLFVYKEDDNGELQSVKWCVGTVKDIGKDPDGLDVADIVLDDKFVENLEDKETCASLCWQKIGLE